MQLTFVTAPDLFQRWDATFYDKAASAARRKLHAHGKECVPLQSVCDEIFSGPFGSNLLEEEYCENGMPIVRPVNLTSGFDKNNLVTIAPEHVESKGLKIVTRQSLLFARVGDPAVGILPPHITSATLSPNIISASVRDDEDVHYLLAFFRSRPAFLLMNAAIKRVTQPTIGVEELADLPVLKSPHLVRNAIGHKVRAVERLRVAAASSVSEAVSRISQLLGTADFSALKPSADGACDYFSGFVPSADLGLFHGAQFYAPKRKRAVTLIKATGIGERLGVHGRRVRSKGKRKAARRHVDPANVSGGDGYWYSGGGDDGGDVVLAKPGQILFLRMRPYLNKTTINDTDQVVSGSPEFLVYEFDGLDAYYATLCLRQPWALAQVAEIATGDRPRVDGEFVDEVVVPWPDEAVRHQTGQLYQSSFVLRRRADQLVQQAIADVENLIDGKLDETACLAEGRNLAEEFGLEVP